MSDEKIFGAFASVRIRFNGNLQALGGALSGAFNISALKTERSEYPPYNEVSSAEVLGWELWLQASKSDTRVFDLRIETTHAVKESFNSRMHDLSPWLARFLAMMCDLEVTTDAAPEVSDD